MPGQCHPGFHLATLLDAADEATVREPRARQPDEALDFERKVLVRVKTGIAFGRLQVGGSGLAPNIIGGNAVNAISAGSFGSVIGGGGSGSAANAITNDAVYATIAGGRGNVASNQNTSIGGGVLNQATGSNATVAGGTTNIASGPGAIVGGGSTNVASGTSSTVPGGALNTASGNFSFAAGHRARAIHDGAFVWADSQDANFDSTGANQFNVRAAGGAQLVTGGTSSSGLLIEQGVLESSGIFFDGDSITMWSPGDNPGNGGRLLRIL